MFVSFVALLIFATELSALTHLVIYSFSGGADGSQPMGDLIADKAGNLYGTTSPTSHHFACNPSPGCGTVFELTRSSGGWIENTLYDFCPLLTCADGRSPQSGLVLDAAGNLYGTTLYGGSTACVAQGCGVVFELSPTGTGWKETVLYTFHGGADGAWPNSGLIFDSAGNLYGTTLQGGNANCGGSGCGTVFKLTKSSSGWTETILHTFLENNSDGVFPEGNLVFDASGSLYGVTNGGGTSQVGTVFALSPTGSGWTETVIHTFSGVDGKNPAAGLTMGNDGNLYGTTTDGGTSTNGGGVVFELTHASGVWNQVVLYNFQRGGINFLPSGGLLFDSVGNLYGVTELGGNTGGICNSNGCGTVFRLTPTSSGSWSQTVLYSLCSDSNCSDGMHPLGGLVFDSGGNLYGTAAQGGFAGCGGNGCGTVFEIRKDASSTSLTLSANSIFSGASVTVTASVSGAGSTPTGSVTFNDGATTLGTGALNGSGVATLTTTSLVSPGAHSITAVYGGDTNYLGSTSSVETLMVNAATFTFSVSPASQTISNGTSASYTLTVTPSGSYTSQITFSCSFSPTSSAKCAADPVTPDANLTTTMLTVSGATPAASVHATNKRSETPVYFAFLTAFGFAGLVLLLANKQSKVHSFRLLPLVGVLILFGCSGGSSKPTFAPPPPTPQKTQTYQVTITATAPASATGSSAAVTTAQVVSLTVNP